MRRGALEAQIAALVADAPWSDALEAISAHEEEVAGLQHRIRELERRLLDSRGPLAGQGAMGASRGAAGGVGDEPNDVLAQRVQELEDANRRLERALLRVGGGPGAASSGGGGLAPGEREAAEELRAQLLERERRVGHLESQLAVARGRVEGAAVDADSELAQMRRELTAALGELAVKEAALGATQDRLSELEALYRGAKDMALSTEAMLEELGRSTEAARGGGGGAAAQQEARDAKSAMAAAARLSARVSELADQEQEARAEAAALRQEVKAVREEHLRDLEVDDLGSDPPVPCDAPTLFLLLLLFLLAFLLLLLLFLLVFLLLFLMPLPLSVVAPIFPPSPAPFAYDSSCCFGFSHVEELRVVFVWFPPAGV